jgi:4-hydroxy-3-polyprenylbenzoate decarboxylase
MMGLWGMGQLALTKMFVVVDDDVNIQDINEVIWAMTARTDPRRDIMIIENAPTDTLDPASPLVNFGSKIGIDATTKWKEEGYNREIQKLAQVDDSTKSIVDKKWQDYGFQSSA